MVSTIKLEKWDNQLQGATAIIKDLKERYWPLIIAKLSEQGANYWDWQDLEIVIWFIENYPEEIEEIED